MLMYVQQEAEAKRKSAAAAAEARLQRMGASTNTKGNVPPLPYHLYHSKVVKYTGALSKSSTEARVNDTGKVEEKKPDAEAKRLDRLAAAGVSGWD